MKNLTKFDSTFFNCNPKLSERLDPQIRIMLESTYEAFIDAGDYILLNIINALNISYAFISSVILSCVRS